MIRSHPLFDDHRRGRSLIPILLGILLIVNFIILISPRIQTALDDLDYGRPRTMMLSAAVGHEDQPGRPTQLIAINLNRQVVVVEFPGGDVSKTRTLVGPYLFGADEDLTPVRLRLELVNGDKLPDLVISIKREEIIYLNENGNFRLITAAERAALEGR